MRIENWKKFDPEIPETWPKFGNPINAIWKGGSGILLLFPDGTWFRIMRNDTIKPIEQPKNLIWKYFQPNYLWINEE